ncbi:MAG: hypothetical protein OXF60_10840 [Gammaproteobacteria bacterium]|nr:hypothetical protein [Gammaproteobacteria bacterium]
MKQNILLSALLAAMLVIAGCGGGNSSTPPAGAVVEGTNGSNNGDDNTNNGGVPCKEGQTVTGGVCVDPKPAPTPDPKFPTGVTAKTLVGTDGEIRSGTVVSTRLMPSQIENADAYGNSTSGSPWYEVLTVVNKDITGNGIKQRVVSADGAKTSETIPANNGNITGPYKGIPGMFRCDQSEGVKCSGQSSSSGSTLGSGWYFIPTVTSATPEFWKLGDDGNYEQTNGGEVLWAEWGYWVTHNSASGQSTVNRRAGVIGTNNIDAASLGAAAELASENNTATYTGKAHGVSVMDDNAGDFTADASLTATFKSENDTAGMGTTLEGMISGFTGQAVNSAWELKLEEATVDHSGDVGRLVGSDDATRVGSTSGGDNIKEGEWTAELYTSTAGNRPTGVVGLFDGFFSDGQVKGVYHADTK